MALASLHRYGLQSQALNFKILCIKALAASATSGITDTAVAAQHVTAGMLLSSFEVRGKLPMVLDCVTNSLHAGSVVLGVGWSMAVVR